MSAAPSRASSPLPSPSPLQRTDSVIINACTVCGVDMGPSNPRQLCGKTCCTGDLPKKRARTMNASTPPKLQRQTADEMENLLADKADLLVLLRAIVGGSVNSADQEEEVFALVDFITGPFYPDSPGLRLYGKGQGKTLLARIVESYHHEDLSDIIETSNEPFPEPPAEECYMTYHVDVGPPADVLDRLWDLVYERPGYVRPSRLEKALDSLAEDSLRILD